jgi:L-asparaginase II
MNATLRIDLLRGPLRESEHLVDVAFVANSKKQPWDLARILFVGDETGNDPSIFPRSAVKFFQAIPLVMTGSADHYRLRPEHLALSCASHTGEDIHTKLVREWLALVHLGPDCLHCGKHEPVDPLTARNMVMRGEPPTVVHHNCSGKHTGVLTTCQFFKEPIADYETLEHPAQERIRRVLEAFTEISLGEADFAVDGCNMPAVRLPLSALARAGAHFSSLATSTSASDTSTRLAPFTESVRRIADAITNYPQYMGGSTRICSEIIRLTRGRVLLKTGAEGVFLVILPHKERAFALKCRDGNMRATQLALVEILEAYGYLSSEDRMSLAPLMQTRTLDFKGRVSSELRLRMDE